jgi:hypothetical protein
MVVTVVVALTALVVALLTAAVTAVRARNRVASLPNAFRCKVAVATAGDHVRYQWPRRSSYAVWVHDVLIVFEGLTCTRVRSYAVHFAEGPVATMVHPVDGLDARPVVMSVETDDGSHALVAAPRTSGALVAGPFIAALLSADDVAAAIDSSAD